MTHSSTKTYEMLWDCEFCGMKKLLGKTHRHCPECGAVQNSDKRYYPADDEKAAVEDHPFVGADRHCPSCNAPNSAKAKFCTECGGPVAEGVEVRGVEEAPGAALASKTNRKEPKNKKKQLVVMGIVGLIILVVGVLVLWKKEVPLTATGHTWLREIHIEQFAAVPQEAWCGEIPRDAYRVFRSREIRSYKQIPDGETCTTKRIDNKDGTFTEKQECTPKYKKDPVYDDKCRFTANRWHETRSLQKKGASLSESPTWPVANLPPNPAAVLGAERPGRRVEQYTVHFVSKEGEKHGCDFAEAKWRTFNVSSSWTGKHSAITRSLDCDSLMPPGAE